MRDNPGDRVISGRDVSGNRRVEQETAKKIRIEVGSSQWRVTGEKTDRKIDWTDQKIDGADQKIDRSSVSDCPGQVNGPQTGRMTLESDAG